MTFTITRNYQGRNGGLLSPDNQRFYVNISKNASSYMSDILWRQGWTAAVYDSEDQDWNRVTELVIVLRDPVDRWCSGVAQYLMTRILNNIGYQTYLDSESAHDIEDTPLSAAAFIVAYNCIIERFIFDNLDLLDDHVWAQHEFFQHIMPTVPRRYIVMSERFEQNILNAGIKIFPDADRHSCDDNMDQSMLKNFFRRRLESKPNLMQLVATTYARDYEIIRNA